MDFGFLNFLQFRVKADNFFNFLNYDLKTNSVKEPNPCTLYWTNRIRTRSLEGAEPEKKAANDSLKHNSR